MKNEVNVKSSTIEKGLDLAKEFLGKLISPTIEEVGLLFADKVKYYRFKNQVKVLLKAKEYVERHNIAVKEIPLKILVPFLDNASLEDNEDLQEKWAKMLANMVDSNTNLQNQIFPYILSQISLGEYEELKSLQYHEEEYIEKVRLYNEQKRNNPRGHYTHTKEKKEIDLIKQEGFTLPLMEYEIANLLRLGLIRQLPPKIYIEEFKTGGHEEYGEIWHQIEAEYEPDEYGYRITELGTKFLRICELNEK